MSCLYACVREKVGRYYTNQKYANHWDAFDLNTEDGRRFAQNGGQRVCTVLVYLNDVMSGGCTSFPRLSLRVQPKKGALVFLVPCGRGKVGLLRAYGDFVGGVHMFNSFVEGAR